MKLKQAAALIAEWREVLGEYERLNPHKVNSRFDGDRHDLAAFVGRYERALTTDDQQPQDFPESALVRVRGATGDGTGVVIEQERRSGCLTILSAYHVVRGDSARVTFHDCDWQTAYTVASDAGLDLCLMRCFTAGLVGTIPLADSEPEVGQRIAVAGWGGGELRAWRGGYKGREDSPASLMVVPGVQRAGDSGGIVTLGGKLVGLILRGDTSAKYARGLPEIRRFVETNRWATADDYQYQERRKRETINARAREVEV